MNSHEQAVASPNARSTNRGTDDGSGLYVGTCLSESCGYLWELTWTNLGDFGACWYFWGHSHLHHRMKNKQSSREDLGPFRLLVPVFEPIICLLWNLQEALLADTLLTNYVFQYLRFFKGSTESWHIWQTMYFQPIPDDETTIYTGHCQGTY